MISDARAAAAALPAGQRGRVVEDGGRVIAEGGDRGAHAGGAGAVGLQARTRRVRGLRDRGQRHRRHASVVFMVVGPRYGGRRVPVDISAAASACAAPVVARVLKLSRNPCRPPPAHRPRDGFEQRERHLVSRPGSALAAMQELSVVGLGMTWSPVMYCTSTSRSAGARRCGASVGGVLGSDGSRIHSGDADEARRTPACPGSMPCAARVARNASRTDRKPAPSEGRPRVRAGDVQQRSGARRATAAGEQRADDAAEALAGVVNMRLLDRRARPARLQSRRGCRSHWPPDDPRPAARGPPPARGSGRGWRTGSPGRGSSSRR